MKETIKDLIKSVLISIGVAMTIFCIVGIVYDVSYGGHFELSDYSFTKMVIGCIVIGLGFGVPSIVYNNDNLPRPIQTVIHMGIGLCVYTITAYAVGWMKGLSGSKGILVLLGAFIVAFLIWYLFIRYYRKEAEILNQRVQMMKK